MKIKELKNKTQSELKTLLITERNRLRELRFKVADGQLKNVREIREVKRTIARILTLLSKALARKKTKSQNR